MSRAEQLSLVIAEYLMNECAVPDHEAKWDALEMIRQILGLMREPVQSQYDALCRTDKRWREPDSETVWKTYIDALSEEAT